jgi:hypothetical protein
MTACDVLVPVCRWVAVVKELRDVFARLEAQGYPRERQEVRLTLVTSTSERLQL